MLSDNQRSTVLSTQLVLRKFGGEDPDFQMKRVVITLADIEHRVRMAVVLKHKKFEYAVYSLSASLLSMMAYLISINMK